MRLPRSVHGPVESNALLRLAASWDAEAVLDGLAACGFVGSSSSDRGVSDSGLCSFEASFCILRSAARRMERAFMAEPKHGRGRKWILAAWSLGVSDVYALGWLYFELL
jgi:hypothetical protein